MVSVSLDGWARALWEYHHLDQANAEVLVEKDGTRGHSLDSFAVELFVTRGVPAHIRSDNGPEFTAIAVRRWLKQVGVRTLFIEPGSGWLSCGQVGPGRMAEAAEIFEEEE